MMPTNPHPIPSSILFVSCSGPMLSNTSLLSLPLTHYFLSFDLYTDPSCMDHPCKMPTNHWVHSVLTWSSLCSGWWSLRTEGVPWHKSQVRSQLLLRSLAWGSSTAGWRRSFHRNFCNIKCKSQQIEGVSIKSPTLTPLGQAVGSNIAVDSSPCPCSHARSFLWEMGYNPSRTVKVWVPSLATVFPYETSLAWAACRATAPNGCHEFAI